MPNNITVTVSDSQLVSLTAGLAKRPQFANVTAFVQDNVDSLAKFCKDELKRDTSDEATPTELAELAAKIAARKAINGGGK